MWCWKLRKTRSRWTLTIGWPARLFTSQVRSFPYVRLLKRNSQKDCTENMSTAADAADAMAMMADAVTAEAETAQTATAVAAATKR